MSIHVATSGNISFLQLINNVVMVFGTQQCDSAIYITSISSNRICTFNKRTSPSYFSYLAHLLTQKRLIPLPAIFLNS